MAGSRFNFAYTMDNGSRWVVHLDRSNALIPGTGFSLPTEEDLNLYPIPRGVKLRHVRFKSTINAAERRIICASTDSSIWKGDTRVVQMMDYSSGSLIDFVAVSRTSEKVPSRMVLHDSGLSD